MLVTAVEKSKCACVRTNSSLFICLESKKTFYFLMEGKSGKKGVSNGLRNE